MMSWLSERPNPFPRRQGLVVKNGLNIFSFRASRADARAGPQILISTKSPRLLVATEEGGLVVVRPLASALRLWWSRRSHWRSGFGVSARVISCGQADHAGSRVEGLSG